LARLGFIQVLSYIGGDSSGVFCGALSHAMAVLSGFLAEFGVQLSNKVVLKILMMSLK